MQREFCAIVGVWPYVLISYVDSIYQMTGVNAWAVGVLGLIKVVIKRWMSRAKSCGVVAWENEDFKAVNV